MCACNGTNRPGCACDVSRYTRIDAAAMQSRLVPSLGCLADGVRDLYTALGARVYEVHLIHTRWSGGQRGLGSQNVVSDVVILPTPLVASFDSLAYELTSIGSTDSGNVRVTQISPRFTETDLRGWIDGAPCDDATQFFYEINFPQPAGLDPIRRRFTLKGTPAFLPLEFQWSLSLVLAYGEREADGEME